MEVASNQLTLAQRGRVAFAMTTAIQKISEQEPGADPGDDESRLATCTSLLRDHVVRLLGSAEHVVSYDLEACLVRIVSSLEDCLPSESRTDTMDWLRDLCVDTKVKWENDANFSEVSSWTAS